MNIDNPIVVQVGIFDYNIHMTNEREKLSFDLARQLTSKGVDWALSRTLSSKLGVRHILPRLRTSFTALGTKHDSSPQAFPVMEFERDIRTTYDAVTDSETEGDALFNTEQKRERTLTYFKNLFSESQATVGTILVFLKRGEVSGGKIYSTGIFNKTSIGAWPNFNRSRGLMYSSKVQFHNGKTNTGVDDVVDAYQTDIRDGLLPTQVEQSLPPAPVSLRFKYGQDEQIAQINWRGGTVSSGHLYAPLSPEVAKIIGGRHPFFRLFRNGTDLAELMEHAQNTCLRGIYDSEKSISIGVKDNQINLTVSDTDPEMYGVRVGTSTIYTYKPELGKFEVDYEKSEGVNKNGTRHPLFDLSDDMGTAQSIRIKKRKLNVEEVKKIADAIFGLIPTSSNS